METTGTDIPRNPIDVMVIEDLSAENLIQTERIAHLESERHSYRELACIALQELARVTWQLSHARRRLKVLQRDEPYAPPSVSPIAPISEGVSLQ